MYRLSIRRDFVARHFLIGGDWGPENELHAHAYRLQVTLEGENLDEHGYLVDILELEETVDGLVSSFRDQILNDQPPFAGLNPSLEHFARILCRSLLERLEIPALTALEVRLWEDRIAWASYRQEL